MATAVVQAGAEILIVRRREGVLEEAAKEMSRFGGPVNPFQAADWDDILTTNLPSWPLLR